MRPDAVSNSDLHIIPTLFQINPPCKAPSPATWGLHCVSTFLLHRLAPAFPLSCCILLRAGRPGNSSCHSLVLEVISRTIHGESSLKKVRETPLAVHRMCLCVEDPAASWFVPQLTHELDKHMTNKGWRSGGFPLLCLFWGQNGAFNYLNCHERVLSPCHFCLSHRLPPPA